MTKLAKAAIPMLVLCLLGSTAAVYSAGESAASPGSRPAPAVCSAEAGAVSPASAPQASVPGSTESLPAVAADESAGGTSLPAIAAAPAPEALNRPVSLEQALGLAFQNSPVIRSALSQVEAARGAMAEARARFNPSFTLAGSTTRQGAINGDLYTELAESYDQASLSIVLPLDISRELKFTSEVARAQFQAQYLSMVSVSEGLIVSVTTAYYDLLRTRGQEAVAQAAVDSSRATLANIRARREEGTLPQFDVTSAEVELENLNQQLIAARNGVAVAQAALNEVLGVDVNCLTQAVTEEVVVTTDTVDIAASITRAYARRPDLRAAQTQVAQAEATVRLREAGLRPSLSLSAGPSYASDYLASTDSGYSWSASASLSLPVWDGGVTRAKVRQAKADVARARASLDQTALAVAKEVRTAALDVQEAALRTRTTAHAVALAEEALSLSQVRYEAGISTLLEVTSAQSQLTEARNNHVNAQYDYTIALAQLQKATSSQPELGQLQLLADRTPARPSENGAH